MHYSRGMVTWNRIIFMCVGGKFDDDDDVTIFFFPIENSNFSWEWHTWELMDFKINVKFNLLFNILIEFYLKWKTMWMFL